MEDINNTTKPALSKVRHTSKQAISSLKVLSHGCCVCSIQLERQAMPGTQTFGHGQFHFPPSTLSFYQDHIARFSYLHYPLLPDLSILLLAVSLLHTAASMSDVFQMEDFNLGVFFDVSSPFPNLFQVNTHCILFQCLRPGFLLL